MATLGNTTVPDTQTSGNVDRVNLNQYTVSGGDFSITTLHTRVSDIVSSGALFRLAVYASDGPSGNAGSLLCYTANLATTGGSFADVSGNPNTPTTLTNGVAYWIGLHFGSNNVALGQVSAASVSRLIQTGATFASGAPNPYTTTPGTGSSPQFCVWLVGAPPVVVPVANFTGTPLTGTEPLSVTFTDSSTNTPTSWAWTFGDGGTSTAQNPSHSYVTAGTFTVALTATNSAGSNTLTRTGYVVVADQPRPIRINTSQGWADIGDASSFVSGSGAPTVAVGATGAIYLDTTSHRLYGPKAAGAWPSTPLGVLVPDYTGVTNGWSLKIVAGVPAWSA